MMEREGVKGLVGELTNVVSWTVKLAQRLDCTLS